MDDARRQKFFSDVAPFYEQPFLKTLYDLLNSQLSQGQVVRGDGDVSTWVDLAPTRVEVDGDTATLADCYDDRTGVYDATVSPPRRLDTDDPRRHAASVTLKRFDGVWKVTQLERPGTECTL